MKIKKILTIIGILIIVFIYHYIYQVLLKRNFINNLIVNNITVNGEQVSNAAVTIECAGQEFDYYYERGNE